MITDKKFLIIASCVVLALLLLVGFALLQKSDDDFSALDVLEGGNEDGGSEDDNSAVGYYRIILSGSCSSEVADAARELETAIEELTGIDCGVTYDMKDVPDRTDAVEILIGNTRRNSSAIALEGLRAEDYVCKWIDGSLVIGGLSNSATLRALERFTNEALPYATSAELMSSELAFSYYHDYEIDSIKLCGFEISDYSIICSEETLEFARLLADGVAQKGGYYLDVKQGTPIEFVKEIVFVIDKAIDDAAYIGYDGEDIKIKAKDAYGASVAFSKLYSDIFGGNEDKVSVSIPSQTAYHYVAPDISVMNVISKITMEESSLPAINDAIARIKSRSPDVVIFGNIKSAVLDMLMYGLSSDYVRIVPSGASGDITAVLYRAQTVCVTLDTAEESGLSVARMRVEHNLSGEKYESLIIAGNSSVSVDELTNIVERNVSKTNSDFVTLMLRENKNYASGFTAAELITKYNSGTPLYNSEYRTMVLCGEMITFDSSTPAYNNSKTAVFVSVTFGKMYCDDYLKNIQQ